MEDIEIITTAIFTDEGYFEVLDATLPESIRDIPGRLVNYPMEWWLKGDSCCPADIANNEGHCGGKCKDYAFCVYDNGVFVAPRPISNDFAVRPLLTIRLQDPTIKIGDSFIFGEQEFEIISQTTAFCKGDIGTSMFKRVFGIFNNPFECSFEDSDVKAFLDNWFKTAD